jgi:hypothetical protein
MEMKPLCGNGIQHKVPDEFWVLGTALHQQGQDFRGAAAACAASRCSSAGLWSDEGSSQK